jgi:hypothetical protein
MLYGQYREQTHTKGRIEMGVVDDTPYSPEVEAELAKPAVRVERTGSVEDAAKAWEIAAFEQAKRANGLRDELTAIRDRINVVLGDDGKTDD